MYSVEESREYFKQKYGALYTDAIKQLEHLLTVNKTGNKHFVAFGLEAGVGKSIEAERIIAEHISKYGEWGSRRFLLVKRFVEDVKTSTDRINDQSTVGNIAIGITRENWEEIEQELSQIEMYPVVIITHSRYFRWSQEPGIRAYFEHNRHTLIIDEQLELPVYSFSDQLYRDMNGSVPHTLVPKLHSICQGLFNEIKCLESKDNNSNLVQKAHPIVDMAVVREFEKDFRANWFHVKGDKARSKVDNFIKFLYSLESGICLYNGKRLATNNKDALRWKLSNNLILDANAGIDRRYNHAKDITVVSPPKIIDHSDTTFHWIKNNSSKSNINKYKNEYYEKVCSLVKAKHGQNDKTLIVTHNQHERLLIDCLREHVFYRIGEGSAYKGEDVAVAHFGAIIGQNH